LLDILVGILPRACASAYSAEYFSCLKRLMAPQAIKLYLAARHGLINSVCALIKAEATNLSAQENSMMVSMTNGKVLSTLVEMLASLLELPTLSARLKRDSQLPVLLHALLCVRGLVMQKTSFIDECGKRLLKLLTALHAESEADRRLFVAACVRSMREHAQGRSSSDGRALIFIFEQLCAIVCPEKPEPDYRLTLNKTATQEEFIRGGMTKNPYSSREIGPLMRDVKNKICRDLDLGGLIEDDNGMELLVAGQIIKLDLAVTAVYEQCWVRRDV
jgi:E3 ubiquitin-protein ligase UBR4